LRALIPGALALTLLTFGIGAGMGLGGTLLPVLVKEHFEARALRASGVYSAAMQSGATISALSAAPLALAAGGWRLSLLLFSIVSLVLVLAWAALAQPADRARGVARIPSKRPAFAFDNPLAWRLALLFGLFGITYYGLSAWLAASYVDRGWSLSAAGALVATLNAGSVSGSIALPMLAQRVGSRTRFGIVLAGILLLATVAIATVPATAFPAAFIGGVANGMLFPVVMAIPVDLTAHVDDLAGITGVMLGVGYTLSALAPSGLGAVRDLTGSFVAVLALIVAAAAALVIVSVAFDAVARRR
jgi:CP family cyanate transporter-like MFS transporter